MPLIREFATVYLDPPFPEIGGGRIKRGCDRHYSVIKRREDMLRVIITAPVWHPAVDSHMWIWITDNYLHRWGVWLVDALGYEIKRSFPWNKAQMGLGQYARGAHEMLYLAVKGKGYNVRTDSKSIRTDYLIGASQPRDNRGRVIHSAKPKETYDLIESRSLGPYTELFARSARRGWKSWGNEIVSS